ncbi:MAG: DOMON-like domain-containing protein [Novosphingobium sp.]|nr:DOMON-like domain-containing protein [Novosphingobium sp.]MDP3905705.1 DOMON-like domain-containing protein [Novosphingobium sp.]
MVQTNTARPELVEGLPFTLQPHPDHPPAQVTAIRARIKCSEPHWLQLRWSLEGTADLVVPPFAGKGRADGLWQTTCFELFVRPPGSEGYAEFNLSPSERWAAYDFTGYRAGMAARPMPRDPDCTLRRGRNSAIFDAAIPLAALTPPPWDVALTAVIEEAGGHKSYWAMQHPDGKADFHHPACFAGTLAAPEAP